MSNTISSEPPSPEPDGPTTRAVPGVSPEHLKLLIHSAIAPEVAAARGYQSIDDPEDLLPLGYADWQANLVPGLLIPIWNVFGENGASQFRPDSPRLRDEKPIKYETPEGARNTLDVHPSMTRFLADPSSALFYTEGIRKADSITSLGYPCIALSGVWSWRGTNPNGGTAALPDFDQVAHNGRQVFLVFDSDVRTNMNVRLALARFSEYLKLRGAASVVLLAPPPGPDGEKQGVDDYIARGGDWNALFGFTIEGATAPPGLGWTDGASFLFSMPEGVPTVWGEGSEVLWPEGEITMIAGPQGVRKTTTAGHLALALAGTPGFERVFGLPVKPATKVTYLALDRPRQIARCLRRLAPEEHRDLIADRLDFWQGPLPFDVVREEDDDKLASWLLERGTSHLIIDSLKDLHGRLSDEEVGQKLIRVLNRCVAVGIQVLVLHHNRKANAENRRPKALSDVHGSDNLTRGIGSVVCLFGAPGDLEIELTHLKQPAEVVGPFVLGFNPETGLGLVDREGMLGTGKKAERLIAIRQHFMREGGLGTTLGLDDLVAAGLGSENTIREALKTGVEQRWLDYHEGVGKGQRSTWTLVPPLAEKTGNVVPLITPDKELQ